MIAAVFLAVSPERSFAQSADISPSTETASEGQLLTQMKRIEAQVDQWFGSYLVSPLATVLFYDFGTGKAWGPRSSLPFVVVWLFLGALFFTLRMGFINFFGFGHAIAVTMGRYDDASKPGEVSHFQALSSALSATVGLGNIAGVAIAVGMGGPGAVFWMVMCGLLGMSSKFTECSLGMLYRKVLPDGTVSGGPMHYLKDGLAELGLKPLGMILALLFTIMCIGGSLGGGCAFQVNQSLNALQDQIPFLSNYPIIYGLLMGILAGTVIIGGIRRIAATAEKIVPFMCGLYMLMGLWVVFSNIHHVPAAFGTIFQGAFSPDAVYGGIVGVMVTGIRRAAFSNEAGVGSAAIAHSAAKTDEPISEGIVALLEPFIDTVIVCTVTGLVIVITGVYNNPEYASLVAGDQGAALTAKALGQVSPILPMVLCLIVFLFAFSTLISWSYYGERCATHLFGQRASMPYKVLFLVFVVLGSVVTATNVKDFSDLMILSMAVPNILGAVLLSGKVRGRLDQYWAKLKSGELKRIAHSRA
jgi:AGCS family alanine or glycine:cation symporter